jgi:NAD(P)-dependent dehydrogenase (short-subunit alcohol dehydrogenase family)
VQRADAAIAVVEEIIMAGGQAHAFQADVSVRSQVLALVDSVVDKWGRLDVLVNNSAISGKAGPIDELTEEEVDQLIATNYKSVIWGIQAASKVLPSGGSIINVSSISSRVCGPVRPIPSP